MINCKLNAEDTNIPVLIKEDEEEGDRSVRLMKKEMTELMSQQRTKPWSSTDQSKSRAEIFFDNFSTQEQIIYESPGWQAFQELVTAVAFRDQGKSQDNSCNHRIPNNSQHYPLLINEQDIGKVQVLHFVVQSEITKPPPWT